MKNIAQNKRYLLHEITKNCTQSGCIGSQKTCSSFTEASCLEGVADAVE